MELDCRMNPAGAGGGPSAGHLSPRWYNEVSFEEPWKLEVQNVPTFMRHQVRKEEIINAKSNSLHS